jgi:hypothetical protein
MFIQDRGTIQHRFSETKPEGARDVGSPIPNQTSSSKHGQIHFAHSQRQATQSIVQGN